MPLNVIATRKSHSLINWKLIISFIKGYRLFFQTMCKHANSVAVCARRIVISEDFMGAAQTRNF